MSWASQYFVFTPSSAKRSNIRKAMNTGETARSVEVRRGIKHAKRKSSYHTLFLRDGCFFASPVDDFIL
jgi:hypothetical protein